MNIVNKLIIAAALLVVFPVKGDEMKMPNGIAGASKSGGKAKAESSPAKTAVKTTEPGSSAQKSISRKPGVGKVSAPRIGAPKVSAPKAADPTTRPIKSIAELTPSQSDKVLALINEGSKEELAAINGIAGTRAESIVSARPFKSLNDLILIPGVGDVTVERIIEHGRKPNQPSAKPVKS